jgi:beta-glucanase (GH16 family)
MHRSLQYVLGFFFVGAILIWVAVPPAGPPSTPDASDRDVEPGLEAAAPGSTAPPRSVPVAPEPAPSESATTTIVPATTTTVPATTTTSPPDPVGGDAGQWTLVFRDEFDGPRLATDRWVTCYWWDDDGCSNEGNDELEWYRPDNVIVDDGRLVLEAREESTRTRRGDRYPYTSGMVTTGRDVDDLAVPPGFVFTYGYVEVRAKVPSGTGLWPAVWLLAADHESRPEIDIIEVLGDTPEVARFHIHYNDRTGDRQSPGQDWIGPDLSEDWHLYAVEWTEDRVVWYLDGVARWEVTDPEAIPREDLYLILNLAVGGEWPGAPDDDTEFPARFLIDYVRIWQAGSGR